MSTKQTAGQRIFFVNRFFHPDESATSRLVSGLAFSLARQGRQIVAISSRGNYTTSSASHARRETVDGVHIVRVRPSPQGPTKGLRRVLGAFTFHITSAATVLRDARPGDIVVAKTDPPLIGVTISLAAAARQAKTIHWLQDIFPETAVRVGVPLIGGPLGAPLRWLRNWSLGRADAVVVIGDRMRSAVLDSAMTQRPVVTITNWFDENPDEPSRVTRTGLRERLLGEADFVVGYSGNLGRAHPIDDMATAIEAMRTDSQTHFAFIGAGVNRSMLREHTAARGLENVSFHPYQDRSLLVESLQVADVHLVVLAPELEGLIVPSKIYGVLAAARPTIFVGDPDGEVAQLIEHFDIGLTVRQGEPHSLVAAIEYLRDNRDRATDMGLRARALYEQRYRRQSAVESWNYLLDAVTASPIE